MITADNTEDRLKYAPKPLNPSDLVIATSQTPDGGWMFKQHR